MAELGLDVVVVRFGGGLGGGSVFAYGWEGGRGQGGCGGGRAVGGIFAAVFALAGGEAGLATVADLLELGVDTVGLVEFDADFSGVPLAVGAGENIGGKRGGRSIWARVGRGRWVGGSDGEGTYADGALEATAGASV